MNASPPSIDALPHPPNDRRYRDLIARAYENHPWGTPEHIEDLTNRLIAHLGVTVVERLEAGYQRGRSSSTPPTSPPHRVPELLHQLRLVVKDIELAGAPAKKLPSWDMRDAYVSELTRHVKVLDAWADHSLFPVLRSELQSAQSFGHNMGMLNLASSLHRQGTTVELLTTSTASGQRMADLRAHAFEGGVTLPIEVKAPRELQRPPGHFSEEEALRAILRSWKHGKGQLPSGAPAVLAIVTSGLCSICTPRLVKACQAVLQESPHNIGRRRPQLGGIGFLRIHEVHRRIPTPDPHFPDGVFWVHEQVTDAEWHYVHNEHYTGPEAFRWRRAYGEYDWMGRGEPGSP